MMRFAYRPLSLIRPAPTLGGRLTRYLPVITVGIEGPQNTFPIPCRLDSGSDDTIVPVAVAHQTGIDLSGAPEGESQGVGGNPIRYPCALVTLRISDGVESCSWQAMVGFINVPRRFGLLGLAGFLDYFDTRLLGQLREVQLEPNGLFPGRHIVH